MSSQKITSLTASKLTTFELRQELVRRNALDIEEDKINYKTMLQRLMIELVKEETEVATEKVVSTSEKYKEERELAKQQREQRKKEALERSQQRQADPAYFAQKQEINAAKANSAPDGPAVEVVPSEEVQDNGEHEVDDDPFRTTKSKHNKVFVK